MDKAYFISTFKDFLLPFAAKIFMNDANFNYWLSSKNIYNPHKLQEFT